MIILSPTSPHCIPVRGVIITLKGLNEAEFKWSLTLSEVLTLASIVISPHHRTTTKDKVSRFGAPSYGTMTAFGCEKGTRMKSVDKHGEPLCTQLRFR